MTQPLTDAQHWRSRAGDAALFSTAVISVAWAVSTYGLGELRPAVAAGFLVFGLLTIFCGFPHP